MSDRPGLRAAAAGDDGMVTDLAAVHVFATSDQDELWQSVRTGTVHPTQQPLLSCVVSGLRRLPTLTGLVLCGGPDDPAAVEAYPVGGDVLEAGLLPAAADPDADLPGAVEVLIWSSTARRLDGLVEESNAVQLVFLPGTVFRVLDVDLRTDPRRVLLAEIPPTWQGRADAGRDERMLDRLRASAQARAERPGAGQWPAGGTLSILPGLVTAEVLRGAA